MKKLLLGGLGVLMFAVTVWAMGPFMPTILSNSKVVTLTGKVSQTAINNYGCMRGCDGIVLETQRGNVAVYGFGPLWYWNRQNVNFPQNGENVTLKAYAVNVNGQTYYVAKEIQLANGTTITLRDQNGYPVWMQNMMRGHGMMNGNMNNRMNNQNMHNMHNDMMCPGMQNMMNH